MPTLEEVVAGILKNGAERVNVFGPDVPSKLIPVGPPSKTKLVPVNPPPVSPVKVTVEPDACQVGKLEAPLEVSTNPLVAIPVAADWKAPVVVVPPTIGA